ncbi:MAG: hypothetical protein ACRDTD_12275 [Pseudonocardiaceae bacterium]
MTLWANSLRSYRFCSTEIFVIRRSTASSPPELVRDKDTIVIEDLNVETARWKST